MLGLGIALAELVMRRQTAPVIGTTAALQFNLASNSQYLPIVAF